MKAAHYRGPAIEPTPLLGQASGGLDSCLTGQPAVRGERALLVAQRKDCGMETLCARVCLPEWILATLTQSRLVHLGWEDARGNWVQRCVWRGAGAGTEASAHQPK